MTSVPPTLKVLAAFIRNVLATLKHSFHTFAGLLTAPYKFWEVSRVVREKIASIPLESKIRLPSDEDRPRGLSNYRPFKVSKHNTASNEGLANIFIQMIKLTSDVVQKEYFYLRVDVDLYMKIIRVMHTSLRTSLSSARRCWSNCQSLTKSAYCYVLCWSASIRSNT